MSEQKAIWWQNLTAEDIVRHAKEVCDIAILPIGAIEQHGPHCPCGDDDFNAIGMAELISKKAGLCCCPALCTALTPTITGKCPGTFH
jgi:creatinine amidohydrolase/Fe(II)-dependent formamide hydrolase-like protein